ncbi:hypothetical protein GCM10022383_03320 [Microbacterium soli]|uniref:HTH luxR-type domain-containing protein n=2 Tax=Microbacterium soli TaxID=446075 RepID=A0ABP7MTI5_9MICO
MPWVYAQRTLSRSSGFPVAPHVASHLLEASGGGKSQLSYVGTSLSREQLAGLSILPDPIPIQDTRLGPFDLKALSPAEARILLTASLSTTQQVENLIDSAAVDSVHFFTDAVTNLLKIRDGYFHLNPAARTILLNIAGTEELTSAHASLARTSTRNGDRASSAWHEAHTRLGSRESLKGLLRTATQQIAHGAVHPAQRAAILAMDTARRHGHQDILTAATKIATQAALGGGYFTDANTFDTRTAMSATRILHQNQPCGALSLEEHIEQLRSLHRIMSRRIDSEILSDLIRALSIWEEDASAADARIAAIALKTTRSQPDGKAGEDRHIPSPLVEAYVRLFHAMFLFQSQKTELAAAILIREVPRLPIAVLALPSSAWTTRAARRPAPPQSSTEEFLLSALGHSSSRLPDGLRIPMSYTEKIAKSDFLKPETGSHDPVSIGHLRGTDLTRREHQILTLLLQGCTAHELSRSLSVSIRTVEVHIRRIYQKLGVNNRAQLIAKVRRGANTPIKSPPHIYRSRDL